MQNVRITEYFNNNLVSPGIPYSMSQDDKTRGNR